MNRSVHQFIASISFFLLLLGPAQASELPELPRGVAKKLIAQANLLRPDEVNIGPLHRVHRQLDEATTAIDGVCVTFIAPKIQNGGRRRIVQTRTFFHDPEWGWYLYAIIDERGGDAIDVVSERKGRIELR